MADESRNEHLSDEEIRVRWRQQRARRSVTPPGSDRILTPTQMATVRSLLEDRNLLPSSPSDRPTNGDGASNLPPRRLMPLGREIPGPFVCPDCGTSLSYVPLSQSGETESRVGGYWQRPECPCEQAARETREAELRGIYAARQEQARRLRIADNKRQSGIVGIQVEQRFSSFDSSRSLLMADAAARLGTWANAFTIGETRRGITLASADYGCGKSHLMTAACHVLLNRGVSVLVASMAELLDEMRRDFDRRQAGATLTRACAVDVLAIDDLGAERIADGERGDWVREQMFTIFDKRSKFARPLLVTTNLTALEIEARIGGDHGGRIVSRLMQLSDWLSVGGPDGRLLP